VKKLFCFYKNSEFIVSEDYRLLECGASTKLNEFLSDIQSRFSSQMKIVQINFEAGHETTNAKTQQPLYPSAKASVFVLHSFKSVNESLLPLELETSGIAEEIRFQSLESKSAFIEKVNIIKKEIAAGRLYQANLTAPLKASTAASAEEIFKKYSPSLNGYYKALLPLNNNCTVISFSPELFLQREKNILTTCPIKGSIKSDRSFETELIADNKEDAELSMIVDLLRNDLNRIEQAPSAEVTKHRAQMQLGYIQHTYSEIQIQTGKPLAEILECTLPGGSISGCPKTESLKVISELEPYRRQVYTGTIGWWQDNEFSLNLAIRTFIKHNDDLYYHAGCGIVYDSVAEKEWDEFILKTGRINAGF